MCHTLDMAHDPTTGEVIWCDQCGGKDLTFEYARDGTYHACDDCGNRMWLTSSLPADEIPIEPAPEAPEAPAAPEESPPPDPPPSPLIG